MEFWKRRGQIDSLVVKGIPHIAPWNSPTFNKDCFTFLQSTGPNKLAAINENMNSSKANFNSLLATSNASLDESSQYRGYNDECTPHVKASTLSPFQFMAFAAITISTIINIINAINNNNNNNDNNNNNNLVSFRLRKLAYEIFNDR